MDKFDYTKLKSLREEKGITQKVMCELLNMTQSNYSKLENGLKKIDSLQTIEKLAKALEIPKGRLIGIMANQENISSSGMKVFELVEIERVIENKPLRQDEFIFFSTEILEIEKHDFKDEYSGINLGSLSDDTPFPIWNYPPEVTLLCSDTVEVGFEFRKKDFEGISIWVGNKKLGVLPYDYVTLVDELIHRLLISRVILIGNQDCIPGFFDTYMKAVFIATNAVCKSAEFKNGRFSFVKFLNQEKIDEIDEMP